jgi:glycosyltransferase involved in cell wall biosynthesis
VKILLISPTQSGIGGIAQHVQGLTKFLDNEGHQVEIMSSENTFTIPIKGLKNPSFMLSSYIKSKFKKTQDIVHAHNIPAALAMKNSSGKKILSLHGVFSQQIDQLHGKTMGSMSKKYEQDALTWADAITVVSKEAFDYYTSLGYNVFQVPNAINLNHLPQDEDRRFKKQIIFVGRISKEKGIKTILDLSKKLSNDINLLVVGSGPESEKIKKLSETRNNIHYLGYQTHENSIKLIRGSDILIQPSLNEGISTTILESMACKIPVIATNVGGNKELIKDKKTGILIKPNDSEELLSSIDMLFLDTKLKEKIIYESFILVQTYDWQKIGQLYLNLYNSLL